MASSPRIVFSLTLLVLFNCKSIRPTNSQESLQLHSYSAATKTLGPQQGLFISGPEQESTTRFFEFEYCQPSGNCQRIYSPTLHHFGLMAGAIAMRGRSCQTPADCSPWGPTLTFPAITFETEFLREHFGQRWQLNVDTHELMKKLLAADGDCSQGQTFAGLYALLRIESALTPTAMSGRSRKVEYQTRQEYHRRKYPASQVFDDQNYLQFKGIHLWEMPNRARVQDLKENIDENQLFAVAMPTSEGLGLAEGSSPPKPKVWGIPQVHQPPAGAEVDAELKDLVIRSQRENIVHILAKLKIDPKTVLIDEGFFYYSPKIWASHSEKLGITIDKEGRRGLVESYEDFLRLGPAERDEFRRAKGSPASVALSEDLFTEVLYHFPKDRPIPDLADLSQGQKDVLFKYGNIKILLARGEIQPENLRPGLDMSPGSMTAEVLTFLSSKKLPPELLAKIPNLSNGDQDAIGQLIAREFADSMKFTGRELELVSVVETELAKGHPVIYQFGARHDFRPYAQALGWSFEEALDRQNLKDEFYRIFAPGDGWVASMKRTIIDTGANFSLMKTDDDILRIFRDKIRTSIDPIQMKKDLLQFQADARQAKYRELLDQGKSALLRGAATIATSVRQLTGQDALMSNLRTNAEARFAALRGKLRLATSCPENAEAQLIALSQRWSEIDWRSEILLAKDFEDISL